MAEIVLGIATSHSPQLRIAPAQWHLLIEKDQKDPRFDYQQLLLSANPTIRIKPAASCGGSNLQRLRIAGASRLSLGGVQRHPAL